MKHTEKKEALANILREFFPEELFDDGIERTAERVLGYWEELRPEEKIPFKMTTFPAASDQLIVVRDIEFSSACAHHLLPFYGVAHIGYIPEGVQVGLSKIPRLVRWFARRPQVQEQLTESIADYLKKALNCKGVICVIEARHTCMSCRGVRAVDASMTTSVVKGVFLHVPAAREEFMNLISRRSL